MAKGMTRREAREAAFALLFETEFQPERPPEDIYALATEDRDLEENEYVRRAYYGVMEKREEIDGLIGKYSGNWKTERLSRVSRAALRLAVYEMLYCDDIPASVSINEAIELTKKFDDPRARSFVNGVLNAVKNDIEDNAGAKKEKKDADTPAAPTPSEEERA